MLNIKNNKVQIVLIHKKCKFQQNIKMEYTQIFKKINVTKISN